MFAISLTGSFTFVQDDNSVQPRPGYVILNECEGSYSYLSASMARSCKLSG